MKKSFITYLILFIGWQLIAMQINNDIILPDPISVISTLYDSMFEYKTMVAIFYTVSRVILSIVIVIILAFALSSLSYFNPIFKSYFKPIDKILKSVPNISIIFIVLLFFGSEKSPVIVVLLITLPVLYTTLIKGYMGIDKELIEALKIFGEDFWTNLITIYIPLIKKDFEVGVLNCVSLGLKVCVMAEVLGQVTYGIGKQMYINKINLEMVGVFAWTIWIILILFIIEKLVSRFFN